MKATAPNVFSVMCTKRDQVSPRSRLRGCVLFIVFFSQFQYLGKPHFRGMASPLLGCTACKYVLPILVCTFLQQQYLIQEMVPPYCAFFSIGNPTVRSPTLT